jgi:hypothetical protein
MAIALTIVLELGSFVKQGMTRIRIRVISLLPLMLGARHDLIEPLLHGKLLAFPSTSG